MIVHRPRTLVPSVAALNDNRVRLFLTSAALLFVELFLILLGPRPTLSTWASLRT